MATLLAANCREALGIDEANLVCPADLPDCVPCEEVEDCGPGTECHTWTCTNSLCRPINAAPMTECSTGVCSEEPVSECIASAADGG
ncbi:hypothetical protein [Polyangium sp. 15x6]|uniref:hypothetical protein n=1 Tax=Polyangium sp. 15x6 TaxID=3042687 RepID=UPI00249C04E3|nr:hypothetical protein [Polyangium sp. 15x6]MDI3292105.1 hypothetical protein [Polyangium sp. 15x6]